MEQLHTDGFASDEGTAPQEAPSKNLVLQALGERVRRLRARRGLTRRSLATSADVSERHLANLEYGTGNVSIMVLHQIASALQCSMAELLGDVTTSSAEWLLIRELLEGRAENELRQVRLAAGEILGTAPSGDTGRADGECGTWKVATSSPSSSRVSTGFCSRSRTKKPRCRRASTRPCASSLS